MESFACGGWGGIVLEVLYMEMLQVYIFLMIYDILARNRHVYFSTSDFRNFNAMAPNISRRSNLSYQVFILSIVSTDQS